MDGESAGSRAQSDSQTGQPRSDRLQGLPMTQARVPPHPSPAWPDALRRGATLGVVASFHLALLALLVRPAEYRDTRQPVPRGAGDALQLVFIPPTQPAQIAQVSAPPRLRQLPAPHPQRTETSPRTSTRATATLATGLPPTPTVGHAAPEYETGDFRTRLQDAQRTRAVPLPGAGTPRVGALRMQVAPSVQDLVRQLAVGTRCTAMRFDMQKKVVTAQLMNRLLEADGCGPHAEHTPTSDTVDAVTRQLMDEQ